MKQLLICSGLFVGAMTLWAQEPSYDGTWVSRNDKNERLSLHRTGDRIHVQEFKGDELRSEYTCGISGKQCKIKEGGHAATVSLWLNGPKLVELTARGTNVKKRRFSLADKGSALDVEVLQISPPGETQTVVYSRD